MTKNQTSFAGSTRSASTPSKARKKPARLFRLDGGYIVLDEAAAARCGGGLAAIAAKWRDYHAIAITTAPEGATESDLLALGRAAQAFDRVVICQACRAGAAGSAEDAARLARAVRSAGRTECHVVGDAHRALRHCIDGMIPGDVIAYCCGDVESAERILAEYGAVPVTGAARSRGEALRGTGVALSGTTGELTAAHV